ncbi:DUF5131 family protein [Desulfovibrio desulfuricans]|uniref:DUF5131 family protein n=1 Tax=Desulfovibrio desulfuricans TaxID=876 RepID=UPI00398455AF
MATSKIEWTEASWNPLTGCTKISPGCKHCYAEKMALRLQAMGSPNYVDGFNLRLHENALGIPATWKKPKLIFVNSMSDLFHEDVPFEFIKRVFGVMAENSHHVFQILTKRSKRLSQLAPQLRWPRNVWMGVSIENMAYTYRIDNLRNVPAAVRFLSCEPLLSSLGHLDLSGIHWVIVGGESGPGARPMEKAWATEIRDTCQQQGVPFFFKQWGGTNKKKAGKLLDGALWHEKPSLCTI